MERRLVMYGTLIPGRSNHHMVEPLGGTWREVAARGTLGQSRWNDRDRLPAFVPDDSDPMVPMWLLVSDALPDSWAELDAFEGPTYRRVPINVYDSDGAPLTDAYVYESLAMEPMGPDGVVW
jgi:gamma-glutamylcyclotransferase (GGCT)/AIG2-like uncharacterized protein YtfP